MNVIIETEHGWIPLQDGTMAYKIDGPHEAHEIFKH